MNVDSLGRQPQPPETTKLDHDLKLYTLINTQLNVLEKIANKSADIIYLRLIQDANIQTPKPYHVISEEVLKTTITYLKEFNLHFKDPLVFLFSEAAISRLLRNGDPYMQIMHEDPTGDGEESIELTEEDEDSDSEEDA